MKLRRLVLLLMLVCLMSCTPTSGEPLSYIGQTDHYLPNGTNQLLQLTQEGESVTVFSCDCVSGGREELFSVKCESGRYSIATDDSAIWLAATQNGLINIYHWRGGDVITKATDIPCLDRPMWFAWHNGELLLDVEAYEPDTKLFTRHVVAYDVEADSWRSLYSAQRHGGVFTYRGYTRASAFDNYLYVSDTKSNITLRINLLDGTQEVAADVCLLSPYVWDGKLYGFCDPDANGSDGVMLPNTMHQQPVQPAVALLGFDCATGARIDTGVRIPWAPIQNGGVSYDGDSVYMISDFGSSDEPWTTITRCSLSDGGRAEIPVAFPADGNAYVDFSDLTVCGEYLVFCFGQGEQAKLPVRIVDRVSGWAAVPLSGGTARVFDVTLP